MKSILKATLLAALATGLALGQTALTTTTLSSAVSATDLEIVVASASGMSAQTTRLNTILFVDGEAMDVVSISGLRIYVRRSRAGSRLSAHASGATVYVGTPDAFAASAPVVGGACTAGTDQPYSPHIVVPTGQHFECVGSLWKQVELDPDPVVSVHVGVPGTGVTAVEKGDGRRHFTTLTLTDVAIGTTVATANEAYGALIYTFPAGIVMVNSASIAVGLTATTTTCDADVPDTGLGTVIATGAVATLDGTATFEDILTGQAADNMTGTIELKTLGQPVGIELAGAHTVHLNIADGMAGASCVITADGTVYLDWSLLN